MNENQSEHLAACIIGITFYVNNIDLDYLKLAAQKMAEQASFQDTAAVLNPHYNPHKNKCLHKNAKALRLLAEYIETLKEIDQLKADAAGYDNSFEEIQKMFL